MKINLDLEDTVHFEYKVMELREDTKRDDLKMLLSKYREDRGSVPSRVIDLFKQYGLINGGELTDAGENFIDTGIIKMPEYGTYAVAYVDSNLVGDINNEGVIAIKRMNCRNDSDVKHNKYGVKMSCFDKERDCTVMAEGTVHSTRPINTTSNAMVKYQYDSTINQNKCIIRTDIKWPKEDLSETNNLQAEFSQNITNEREPAIDDKIIKEDLILNYDRKFDAIVVDDLKKFTKEELLNLKCDVKTDQTILKCCSKKIKNCSISDVPIVTKSDEILEEWMNKLRIESWNKRFVTPSETLSDQTRWDERINKTKFNRYVLSNEELIGSLDGNRAFWNVAAPMDLCPGNSECRTSFDTVNGDVDDILKKNIFNNSIVKNIKTVYYADRYMTASTPSIFRTLVGEKPVINLIVPKSDKNNSAKVLMNVRSDKLKVIPNTRDWIDTHSRVLILKMLNGTSIIWTFDNSIDHFSLKEDGHIYCDVVMKVSPSSTIDPELEALIKEAS